MGSRKTRKWIGPSMAVMVIVHLAISLWHGMAHRELQIELTAWQAAFVGIVIVLLPLVSIALFWTKWRRPAIWLVALSMFASLVFGVVNHFVLVSSDNVMTLPEHPWRHPFALSADLLAFSELIGVIFAAAGIWQERRK